MLVEIEPHLSNNSTGVYFSYVFGIKVHQVMDFSDFDRMFSAYQKHDQVSKEDQKAIFHDLWR